MENSGEKTDPNTHHHLSRSELDRFFLDTLEKMYFAEQLIEHAFWEVKNHEMSQRLAEILQIHFAIQRKHKERMEKIFLLRDETIQSKESRVLVGLLAEAKIQLDIFADDIVNWEIALILVVQKITYYKIASYGGLAHLAITLEYHCEATLMAVSVQEEEEFLANNLTGIFEGFVSDHLKGFKNETK